jgi:hypothetical protein
MAITHAGAKRMLKSGGRECCGSNYDDDDDDDDDADAVDDDGDSDGDNDDDARLYVYDDVQKARARVARLETKHRIQQKSITILQSNAMAGHCSDFYDILHEDDCISVADVPPVYNLTWHRLQKMPQYTIFNIVALVHSADAFPSTDS